ncbi:MAG: glycosyltransferase family 4 protein [Opitutaceae bacterium]
MGHDQAGDDVLKRILIIPASYPPVLGGVQTVAQRLVRHLIESHHQVEVLTRRYPRRLPAMEVIEGVPIHRRPFQPSPFEGLQRMRPDLALRACLSLPIDRRVGRRILERFDPTLVNIHFPDWQVDLIPFIRSLKRSRLVVSLHGDEVMRAVKGEGGQRDRLLTALRAADFVTACSGWLLEQAIRLEPAVKAKSMVIWNGFDAKGAGTLDASPHKRPYMLGFGRFVEKKGFDLLIEAFAGLEVDLDLVLVGSGPERERLSGLTEKLGLSGRVFFPGRAYPDEMNRWIGGARLAVVPSREEPFGIAALEVVGAGTPLVATTVGGMTEFLEPLVDDSEAIRLCDVTVGSIRNAIHDLLKKEAGTGKPSVQADRIRDRFDWSRRILDYDAAFAAAERA